MKFPLPLRAPRFLAGLLLAGLATHQAHAVVILNPSGANDRTSDINTAIGNARAAGDYVMLNAGTYYHDDEITISGAVELRGAGDSTVLISRRPIPTTNPSRNGTIRLTGTGPKLRNIKVKSTFTGPYQNPADPNFPRSQAHLSTRVYMKDAISFLVENVTAEDSQGSGMIVTNGSRGTSSSAKAKIINCRISKTMADGIHITSGVKWVSVENCNITNTGDDMIAIVSKVADPGSVTTDMTILNNTVSTNYWGRGITVVGGTNVTIRGNTITKAHGSGVLLASDSYDVHPVSGITVENNTITEPNMRQEGGQNGITIEGILKDSQVRKVSNVTLKNNTITNSKGRGVVIGRYSENITLQDMKINGTVSNGVEITSSETTGSTYPKNITITGASTTASYIKNTGEKGVSAPRCAGSLTISKTGFEQINKTGATSNDVIGVSDKAELTAISIINNDYSNPSTNGVQRYIECLDPNFTPKPVTGDGSNTKAAGITTGSFWAP